MPHFVHWADRLPCTLCNYRATTEKALKKHGTEKHADTLRPHKCPLCPFRAKTEPSLRQHNTKQHTDHPPYKQRTPPWIDRDSDEELDYGAP